MTAAIALGGLSPVVAKRLLAHVPLEALLVLRYSIAAAAILLASPLKVFPLKPRGRPRPSSSLALAVVALLGSGVGAFLFTASLLYAPAAVSNAVSKTGPLFVAFLAYVVLQEQVSLGAASLLAAMLLAAGLLSAGEMRSAPAEAGLPLLGAALAAAAGLTRAVAEVAAKAALSQWPPAAVAAARFGGGVAVAGAALLLRPASSAALPASPGDWGLLVFLAVGATALPLVLYYRAMAALPVHVVAGVRTTAPIVTALASWALLGERLNVLHWLGIGALLLAAYAMASIPVAARRASRLGSLSASLLRFVAGVVAVAVVLAGALQAWQLQSLMRRQTRAAVGRSAALIAELLAVTPPVPQPVLRSYLERVVSERLSTPGYSVEFAYLVAADAHGTPMAWAFAPGQRWPPMSPARLAAAVTAEGPSALGRGDLLAATVAVTTGGRPVGYLYAGYRASVAVRPFFAVAARTAALAGILAALAAAAASSLVRSALAPLAAAASDVIAGSAATEASATGEMVAEWLGQRLRILPADVCVLAAARPLGDGVEAWAAAATAAAADAEGLICGAFDGWLLCCWGVAAVEPEDCLRAFAWATMVQPAEVVLAAGEDAVDQVRQAIEAVDAAAVSPAVLATPPFASACSGLQFTPASHGLLAVSEPL